MLISEWEELKSLSTQVVSEPRTGQKLLRVIYVSLRRGIKVGRMDLYGHRRVGGLRNIKETHTHIQIRKFWKEVKHHFWHVPKEGGGVFEEFNKKGKMQLMLQTE